LRSTLAAPPLKRRSLHIQSRLVTHQNLEQRCLMAADLDLAIVPEAMSLEDQL